MKLIKSLFLPLLLVTMFTNNAKGQFTSKCKLTYKTTEETMRSLSSLTDNPKINYAVHLLQ